MTSGGNTSFQRSGVYTLLTTKESYRDIALFQCEVFTGSLKTSRMRETLSFSFRYPSAGISDQDLPLPVLRPNLRPTLETSLRIRALCLANRPFYRVVDVHAIGHSLFHCVQDISVNMIELQGFVLLQVRLVIVEELCLNFGRCFPVGLLFGIGFPHTLRQVLFESFGSLLSSIVSGRV